jgi:hypothetical protein
MMPSGHCRPLPRGMTWAGQLPEARGGERLFLNVSDFGIGGVVKRVNDRRQRSISTPPRFAMANYGAAGSHPGDSRDRPDNTDRRQATVDLGRDVIAPGPASACRPVLVKSMRSSSSPARLGSSWAHLCIRRSARAGPSMRPVRRPGRLLTDGEQLGSRREIRDPPPRSSGQGIRLVRDRSVRPPWGATWLKSFVSTRPSAFELQDRGPDGILLFVRPSPPDVLGLVRQDAAELGNGSDRRCRQPGRIVVVEEPSSEV